MDFGCAGGGTPALGASGAVNGVVLLHALLFPTRIVYVNLIFPVPSIAFAALVLGRDFLGAAQGYSDGVGHAAHVGGASVGAAAWALLRMGRGVRF